MRSQRSSSLRCKGLRVIEFANSEAALLAHHFHDYALVPLAIKFGVENSLPGAEIQPAGSDRDDNFMVNEQRFQMRVAVVFAGAELEVFGVESHGLATREGLSDPLLCSLW